MIISPTGRPFEFIGHRGYPGNPLNSMLIENTIESFQWAFKFCADAVELDAILSKDGILVVHHDDRTGRVFVMPGDNQKLVGEYTFAELQQARLNEKGLKAELQVEELDTDRPIPTRIPRLDEVVIPKGKKLFLELKFIDDKLPSSGTYLQDLVRAAADFIKSNGLVEQTYVLSFVGEALDAIKKLNPNITTAYNVYQHEAESKRKVAKAKRDYGVDIMNPPYEQATKQAIANMHDAGLKTYPWAWKQSLEEELDEVVRLLDDGADGVITNQVDSAVSVVLNKLGII